VLHFTLAYDMRAPDFGARPVDLYKAAIDQCEWADRLGGHQVSLLEHHASTDSYLPSPIVLGAAIASRTHRMLIRLGVMLLPLYHPLRAAEDLAVLDLICGGRLRVVVGAGYREAEYAQFGLSIHKRPSLMEAGIDALKQAWTGEPFEYDGRTVRILPRPAQTPRPAIHLGGSSVASAARAARIADGYDPVSADLFEHYRRSLAELGKPVPEPAPARTNYPFIHVANDPDAAWRKIAPHAMLESNDYGRWLREAGASHASYQEVTDPNELRGSGKYQVVTPPECVELAKREGTLSLKPLMGGLDPALAWESLRLFEQEVLPAFAE
jgi:alkanesulfonate monooxygenase SsuD/methylene tetrahydromethanopterin reductase-like flavin-dependent oxidoreductase (luciferase family)